MRRYVKVNERGRRVGESHPRAKLSDHEVDLLRELVGELVEAGIRPMEAYRIAGEKFEVHPRTAQQVVLRQQRQHEATEMRRVALAK